MELTSEQARRHLVELMHDEVWVSDEPTKLDADHAKALARLGLGYSRHRSAAEGASEMPAN